MRDRVWQQRVCDFGVVLKQKLLLLSVNPKVNSIFKLLIFHLEGQVW